MPLVAEITPARLAARTLRPGEPDLGVGQGDRDHRLSGLTGWSDARRYGGGVDRLEDLIDRFDVDDPVFIADPYPALNALREATPVFWNSGRTNGC